MRRRTLLRAAGATAGALAAGGLAALYGFRDDDAPAAGNAERWRVPLPDQPDALLLAGDTLLALGASLTAYGAADGKVRWRQDLGRNTVVTGRPGTAPLSAGADTVVFRTNENGSAQVRAVGLGDGRERWRRQFEGYVGDAVLTARDTVAAVADGTDGRGLSCFDGPADRWRQVLAQGDADGPFDLLADGTTVYAAGRELVAFTLADGVRTWGVAAAEGHVFGRPAVRAGLAVVLGMRYVDDDYLYRSEFLCGVDTAEGRVRWQYDAPGGYLQDGPPLLTGRGIVAVHESGRLTGLDPATGAERWNYDWDFADILALGDHVYVATADGVAIVDPTGGHRLKLLEEPNAYRLAGSGPRLCVAAGDTLAVYDVG